MGKERVSIVTDSGCSMRPEYQEVKNLDVTIVPLTVTFLHADGTEESVDDTAIDSATFYARMAQAPKPPKTSGAVIGPLTTLYETMLPQEKDILSVHITSVHSKAYESALNARNNVFEDYNPSIAIEVFDSQAVSLGTWFLAEHAALLAQKGASLNQIQDELVHLVPRINHLVVVETLDNLKAGGRFESMKATLAGLLHISPIIGVQNGKLTVIDKARTAQKARDRMIERVADTGPITKLAVVHTNALERAYEIRDKIQKFFPHDIAIRDTGSAIACHAGPGAVGVIYQTAQ